MELTFLGTGSAYPSPSRGASCIIYRNQGTYWMFDCGEGSQIQLMKSSIRPGKISKIFITHLHGDHLFGLPGLMCTISLNCSTENKEPVEVYGPRGLAKYLRVALGLSRSQMSFDYTVHELTPVSDQFPEDWQDWAVESCSAEEHHPNEKPGSIIEPDEEGVWHVYKDGSHVVKASWLCHKVPSFGFAIQEQPLPGKLDATKLAEKGIPRGPLYSKIKAGESITSPTGEVVHPADVVGREKPGRLVAILGDSSDSRQMAVLCQNADVLVHEATLENGMKDNAIEKGHSTPGMAGEFAKSVAANCLILTHFSQRYKSAVRTEESDEPTEGVELLVEEARTSFGSDNIIAANDFLTIPIKPRNPALI